MSEALRTFLYDQLAMRGESVEQFAARADLNSSGVYQILRGERQFVQDKTLDKMASALDMTLAEMAKAMGRAAPEDDPEEVEVLALFRQVPAHRRAEAKDLLRWLSSRATRVNSHRSGRENARRGPAISTSNNPDSGSEGQKTMGWNQLRPTFSLISTGS